MSNKFHSIQRFTHVHRIDDFVLRDVREFILHFHELASLDVQLSLSDFLTTTRIPYRAKSNCWKYYEDKKSKNFSNRPKSHK